MNEQRLNDLIGQIFQWPPRNPSESANTYRTRVNNIIEREVQVKERELTALAAETTRLEQELRNSGTNVPLRPARNPGEGLIVYQRLINDVLRAIPRIPTYTLPSVGGSINFVLRLKNCLVDDSWNINPLVPRPYNPRRNPARRIPPTWVIKFDIDPIIVDGKTVDGLEGMKIERLPVNLLTQLNLTELTRDVSVPINRDIRFEVRRVAVTTPPSRDERGYLSNVRNSPQYNTNLEVEGSKLLLLFSMNENWSSTSLSVGEAQNQRAQIQQTNLPPLRQ